MMKRLKLFVSVLLSLLMALSLLSFVGCGPEKPPKPEPDPEPEIHQCESKCPVCEKCLDAHCEEDACKVKCDGEGKTAYKFEGEDERVNLCGGSMGVLGIGQEFGSDQRYVANFNANIGASINYYIDSAEDTVASLIVSVCKRTRVSLFTNVVAVMINGEMIDRSAIVPASDDGADTWVDFVEVNLGCINLKAGRNTLKFAIMDADAAMGYNFNYMTLKAGVEVKWHEGPHICESVCPECGKCTNLGCKNPVCEDKCEADWTDNKFSALDEKVKVAGGAFKNAEGNYVGGLNGAEGASVTFNISSLKKQNARIIIEANKRVSANTFADAFILTVNGVEVPSTVAMPTGADNWDEFEEVDVAPIELKINANVIKLATRSADPAKGVNLRSITIKALDTTDWSAANQFAAMDERVTVSGEGGAFKNPTENCIGMSNAKDQTITYNISADKAVAADIAFSFCHKSRPTTFNEAFKLFVNGVEIDSTVAMPTGGSEWHDYEEVKVATVNLVVGKNVIELVGKDADNTVGFNVRYLYIGTEATLDWYKAEVAGFKFEAENADSNAWLPLDKLHKVPTDQASGGVKIGHVYDASLENKEGEDRYYLEFKIDAEAACTAELLISLSLGSESIKSSGFPLRVNGVDIAVDKTWTNTGAPWDTFEDYSYGNINLTAGSNTIKIFIGKDAIADIDFIKLVCDTVLS